MARIIDICPENIANEHICCAFSDKKSTLGYAAKKEWLTEQFGHGYRFKRLDARGKVFIEYVPAEHSWLPLEAAGYMVVNCFWVAGQFKGQGYGKQLLEECLQSAAGTSGVVAVTGEKKRPYMSDPQFLQAQGFECVDSAEPFFKLWCKKLHPDAPTPRFSPGAKAGRISGSQGIEAFYSATCPFTDYWTNQVLPDYAKAHGIPCVIHRLSTQEQGRAMPVPWVINSVFYNGGFVTLEMDSVKKLEVYLESTR
jgi:GNAT superfamily N-acetyltransferase